MTLEDHLQIEEILAEANAYGLKSEVAQTAVQFVKDGYSNLDAHSLAFNEWIK